MYSIFYLSFLPNSMLWRLLCLVLHYSGFSRELSYLFMETHKSRDLQGELTCWRLRRTSGVVPVLKLAGLRLRKW